MHVNSVHKAPFITNNLLQNNCYSCFFFSIPHTYAVHVQIHACDCCVSRLNYHNKTMTKIIKYTPTYFYIAAYSRI